MQTPFPFETIAPKEFFYGREKELNELKAHISNSTNVLLFSKRRMGKSTLIKNLFDESAEISFKMLIFAPSKISVFL